MGPIFDPPEKNDSQGFLALGQKLNDLLGDFIKRYPDQWMWGHRRWKTTEGVKKDPHSF
jgi:lauroyl/myristoyl acyltransferase